MPISETVQDSYNEKPFKSKIVCPLALAVIFISLNCVSLNGHQRRQTCWVRRREGWKSACCHQ